MSFTKGIICFFFLQVIVVHCWHWKKYETHGRICDPAPIGVPAYSEKQCQDACSKHARVKYCQFNYITKNWCMMGYACTRQWMHKTHRYIVWVKVDDQPHHGDCIKLVHGEPCSCKTGNCDSGKLDIKKWLGGKCGVSIKHQSRAGRSFSEKMMKTASYGLSWQYNWGTKACPWKYPSNVKYVAQFWGAKKYDFPQLKLDGNYQPTKDNSVLPILLGFNEPDLTGKGASSMSVETAVEYWKFNVINGIKRGYRQFVSPAMAQPVPKKYNGRVEGKDWLPNFLNRLAREPRHHENLNINGKTFNVEIDWKSTVDYVAMHRYEPNCQISARSCWEWDVDLTIGGAKRMLDDYNKRGFNIKGVWLTEFAGTGRAHCKSLAQQKALLEKWVPLLLKDDAVTAMAWFSYDGAHSPFFSVSANLWNYRTEIPTELGKKYFDLCSRHKY